MVFAEIRLTKLPAPVAEVRTRTAAFHVRRTAREELSIEGLLFAARGDVVFADMAAAHRLASQLNARHPAAEHTVQASELAAMGLIHEILHVVVGRYRRGSQGDVFGRILARLRAEHGEGVDHSLRAFVEAFPPEVVFRNEEAANTWLRGVEDGIANEQWALEEMLLAWLSNENPAFLPIAPLVSDAELRATTPYLTVVGALRGASANEAGLFGEHANLVDLLLAPIRHAPGSLLEQLAYMRDHWGLDVSLLSRIVLLQDTAREEAKWFLRTRAAGPPSPTAHDFGFDVAPSEPERFTPDRDWMPRVVMVAKSTFVWLGQLSREYGRDVHTLADIPDEELARLASRGFTGLWLIGVWERSRASAEIKRRMGNPEAVASAYSLYDYEIAGELGGYRAYEDLRDRAARHGLRLASDMVPNHVGIDARWVKQHPGWFLQAGHPPFPGYRFSGPDLGDGGRVGIAIEDGYWTKSDAAVVFQRRDKETGDVRYFYHGNDGTSMPWNDTAQLDYTQAEVREAVIQTILHVARLFPILRFDAAMTLAKRHYQRLWFPPPGSGGDIPSRAAYSMSPRDFDALMPTEFWRDVVERIAQVAPDTLLLAEAFWMMEGYFVRSLGMHRVYNSAFMHMMKNEDNAAHKKLLKDVLLLNAQILRRYVNFMNNPDEETAVAQFGRDDKYFGVATVMCTLPGLPMFGHGQVEGYGEKYGMEYKRAYWEETPDLGLVARHEREIFPLLRRRALFADVASFRLYDLVKEDGTVDDDVYAFTNRCGDERTVVVYHNRYKETRGWLRTSVPQADGGVATVRSLADSLGIERSDALVVVRDVPSTQEAIFETSSLYDHGLFVELGAYKYRVLHDFRFVHDEPRRPFRELARRLGGRFVPSIENALDDLVHEPQDEALRRLLYYDAAALPALLDLLAPRIVPDDRRALEQDVAHARDKEAPPWLVAAVLAASFGQDGVLALRLHRVLSSEDACLARIVAFGGALSGGTFAVIRALFSNEEAAAFLGVHESGGTRWFRKEAFERLVDAFARFGELAASTQAETASERAELLRAAQEAGYDEGRFLAALDALLEPPPSSDPIE